MLRNTMHVLLQPPHRLPSAFTSVRSTVPCIHCKRNNIPPVTYASRSVLTFAGRQYGDNKPLKKAFVIVITGQLAKGHVEKFKKVFTPLAAYVAENEDGCLAYEMSTSISEPDKIVLYERYKDKEYAEKVHFTSDAFKQCAVELQEAGIEWVERNVMMCEETDIGF